MAHKIDAIKICSLKTKTEYFGMFTSWVILPSKKWQKDRKAGFFAPGISIAPSDDRRAAG